MLEHLGVPVGLFCKVFSNTYWLIPDHSLNLGVIICSGNCLINRVFQVDQAYKNLQEPRWSVMV
jgi:hypothetical protein